MQFTSVAYEAPWHIDDKPCLDIGKNLKDISVSTDFRKETQLNMSV